MEMGKVGGDRNFGYGKKMAWAGKQAIQDRYGQGHHASVAGRAERWAQFTAWAKASLGIGDARAVTREVLAAYGQAVADRVAEGLSVAYAQNLLSTVNVVLETMRGDRLVRVSPVEVVGERSHVRTEAPAGLDRQAVRECAERLRETGHARVAAVVELARELGLREREASMLDVRTAFQQATTRGAVNITAGTKGGRGHRVDRWVSVSKSVRDCLQRAVADQGGGKNLIPADKTWRQWNDRLHHIFAAARGAHGLGKLYDLRAGYACERYYQFTGSPAPVVADQRLASRDVDWAARETIARELGHGRIDVVAAYCA